VVKYKEKRDKKQGEWADGSNFFGILFVLRLSLSVSQPNAILETHSSSPSNVACFPGRRHILSGRRYGKDIKVFGTTQIGAPSC
jgi:hypothetical protein